MSRTFITGIAIAAFIAVELLAVQPTEAQRLRNLLRRNNNNGCNNCCEGCGVNQSTGSSIVSEGYVESSSATSQGVIFSESPMTSFSGETISSPMSAPMNTYNQPIVQGPTESFAPTQSFAQSQPYVNSQPYMDSQPYVESYSQPQPTYSGDTMAQAMPYVDGMPTSEYPIETGSINSYSVTPASYEVAQGCVGCGTAAAEQASWTYDNGAVQGQIIGDSNIVEGGIVNGGFVVSGGSQGQVLGCATGDCGGQAVDSGQIIGGGQVIGGNAIITSGTIVNENQVYGGATGFDGGAVEQIISSEIISETPIDATDSTGTPEVSSPAEPAPSESAPSEPSSDQVPDAPDEDGKEA